MPYNDIPKFIKKLRSSNFHSSSKLALEFLLYTGSRTNEVLGAKWEEIDFNNKIWTIPEERMKAGKEHRVPLSDRAIQILKEMKRAIFK